MKVLKFLKIYSRLSNTKFSARFLIYFLSEQFGEHQGNLSFAVASFILVIMTPMFNLVLILAKGTIRRSSLKT